MHLLGISHDSPANVRCISRTVDALQPDVIGIETPNGTKHLKTAAGSRQLQPLLDRLMTTPLRGIAHATTLLPTGEEREQWARGLDKGELEVGDGGTVEGRHGLLSHYVHGHEVSCSDLMAGTWAGATCQGSGVRNRPE